MNLKDLVHEVAVAVGKIKYLNGVPVIEEELGDVSKKLEADIAKQKVAILVGWSGAEPVKQSGAIVVVDVNVVVSIFEKPVTNRKTSGAPTICNMAQEIAKILTYAQAEGMACPLFLKRITPISELGEQGGGTVTCDVVFNTKAEL